jgi:hypothetical protein
VAVLCVGAGAVAGIAGSAAAPTKTTKPRAGQAPSGFGFFRHHDGRGGPDGFRGRAVHGEEVVLNKAGTAFITVTDDNGTVVSVSGDQLTIKEAIGSVTYKQVTLTIPAGATVVRNFKKAALSDLKAGDRVHVSQSSDGTFVFAADGSARPPMMRGRFAPGADGPPPAGPPPAGAPGVGIPQ